MHECSIEREVMKNAGIKRIDTYRDLLNELNITIINDRETIKLLREQNEKLKEQLSSAQLEQRWIQCSERLPNSQTEVIVSCRDDSADTIYRYTASGWITTNGEYWIVDNEINPYVVAWMPLPEPWKGEQHG